MARLARTTGFAILLLAASLLLLPGCDRPRETIELNGLTMGTSWSVKLVPHGVEDAAGLATIVQGILDDIDGRMSTYRPESELSRINASRGTGWLPVSQELADVLAEAKRISLLTGGAFDITVGPLVNLWGFGPGNGEHRLPGEDEIEAARTRTGHGLLQVRTSRPAVRKARPDLYLDLSAIAKGHAVDQVAARLDAMGVADYLVEIGGEVRGRGRNARGIPWQIAVERPSPGPREVYAVFRLDDSGAATSGDYRNFFEASGQRYSHTIDPLTGYPVSHHLASVTVIDPSVMRADALATALMVLGPDEGYELAQREGLAAFFIVKDDGGFSEKITPAFMEYIVDPEGRWRSS